MSDQQSEPKLLLRQLIQAIFDAASYLDDAITAHLAGNFTLADKLIRLADIPAITEWAESPWGKGGPHGRPLSVSNPAPWVPKEQRIKSRMPSRAVIATLLARDGFNCRFCGIPVVRRQTRILIRKSYPAAMRWGINNVDQHAGFQVMWLQI